VPTYVGLVSVSRRQAHSGRPHTHRARIRRHPRL